MARVSKVLVGAWESCLWFHEQIDPMAETVADIVKALNEINLAAAEKFVELYLGELIKGEDEA